MNSVDPPEHEYLWANYNHYHISSNLMVLIDNSGIEIYNIFVLHHNNYQINKMILCWQRHSLPDFLFEIVSHNSDIIPPANKNYHIYYHYNKLSLILNIRICYLRLLQQQMNINFYQLLALLYFFHQIL